MERERGTHELKSAEAETSQDTEIKRVRGTYQLECVNGGTSQDSEKSDRLRGTHHLGRKVEEQVRIWKESKRMALTN